MIERTVGAIFFQVYLSSIRVSHTIHFIRITFRIAGFHSPRCRLLLSTPFHTFLLCHFPFLLASVEREDECEKSVACSRAKREMNTQPKKGGGERSREWADKDGRRWEGGGREAGEQHCSIKYKHTRRGERREKEEEHIQTDKRVELQAKTLGEGLSGRERQRKKARDERRTSCIVPSRSLALH